MQVYLSRAVWPPLLLGLALWLLLYAQLADSTLLLPQTLLLSLLVALSIIPALLFGQRLRSFTRLMRVLLAATVLSLPLALGVAYWQDQLTQHRRGQLVAQLAAYHRQNKCYPDSLTQLVPRYLPTLPATGYGLWRPRPFRYQRGTGATAYVLYYDAGGLIQAQFDSQHQRWQWYDCM